jgi:SAM-dependent methyltransferase
LAISTPDSAWPSVWAEIYDAMDVDRAPHLEFYTRLVTPATRSLLDLACGTGSITVPMAGRMQAGATIVGVDLSPKMIEIAAARAPSLSWLVGDICAPPVSGTFDLVTICFHTLQAMLDDADLDRAIGAAAALLSPQGRFAFDIYQPNPVWLASVDPAAYVARSYVDPQGATINVVESQAYYDSATRILSGEWRLQDAATGRMLPVEPIVQRVRQYDPHHIDAALTRAGLLAVERYGELDRRPLAPGTKRQVYVCQRRPA